MNNFPPIGLILKIVKINQFARDKSSKRYIFPKDQVEIYNMWKFEAKILKTQEVIEELVHFTLQYHISNPVRHSKLLSCLAKYAIRICNPVIYLIGYLTRLDIRFGYLIHFFYVDPTSPKRAVVVCRDITKTLIIF